MKFKFKRKYDKTGPKPDIKKVHTQTQVNFGDVCCLAVSLRLFRVPGSLAKYKYIWVGDIDIFRPTFV